MAMDCGQAAERIARTLSGNAAPGDEAELKRHLLTCLPCRESHDRLSRVWSLMGSLPQIALPREVAARVASQATAPRLRRLPWIAGITGFAAAAVLSVLALTLFRTPAVTPVAETPAPKVAPEEPRREDAERSRVERLLTEADPTPKGVEAPVVQTPKVTEPVKAPAPVPAPVAQSPETPAPKQPEPREVVRETPPAAQNTPKPPAERETVSIAATLNRVEGSVLLVSAGVKSPAKAGQAIPAGAGIETVGATSQAVFEYADGSRIALGGDTILGQVWDRHAAEGKTIQLTQGLLAAQVVKQADSMIFLTPHAEAKVLGTRLSLTVSPASTRLDVRQGRVKLTRREDGASAEVSEGRFALAGKGLSPTAKAAPGPRVILAEPFATAKWNAALVRGGDAAGGLRFSTETGALSLHVPAKAPPEVTPPLPAPGTPNAGKIPPDVAKKALETMARSAALGAKSDLPRALWLETRQTFAPSNETPLRIRARLWQSHEDADHPSWVALNRATPGQALTLERRGGLLQLWSEAAQAAVWKKEFPCVQEWEALELWLSKDLLVIRRNDQTVYSGPNPLKMKVVQVSFGSNAKAELSQDEEARFDDFELCWMTKADLEDVVR